MEDINFQEGKSQILNFFNQVPEMQLIRKRVLNHGLNNYSRVSQNCELGDSLILGNPESLPESKGLCNIASFRTKFPREFGFHLSIRGEENPAPPAAPSYNIGGVTTHSIFQLPCKASNMAPLSSNTLYILSKQFEQLRIVLIDETSLIGSRMLFNIDKIIWEILHFPTNLFGDVDVIFYGDFYQAKSICDSWIAVVHQWICRPLYCCIGDLFPTNQWSISLQH